jgi:hypothetical protein
MFTLIFPLKKLLHCLNLRIFFEVIRKNDKDCKETLKRYNFRKPKREASISEQAGPISIFDFEKEK